MREAMWTTEDGQIYSDERHVHAAAIAGMRSPVRCTHCPGVYDLATVTVTARYSDCSMWKSPCCNLLVDDRGETGWKPRGDYVRLSKGVR